MKRDFGYSDVPEDLLKAINEHGKSVGYTTGRGNGIRALIYNGKSLQEADEDLFDIIKEHVDQYTDTHPEYKQNFTTYENVFFHLFF